MDTQNSTASQITDEAIEEIANGDKKLAVFIVTLLQNDLNASKTYQILHPNVTPQSARVLGAREFAKVNISSLLAMYGLDHACYLQHLSEGLNATRWNGDTKEYEPDMRVRRLYHAALGQVLKVEKTEINHEKQTKPPLTYIPASWFHPPPQPDDDVKGESNEPDTTPTTG